MLDVLVGTLFWFVGLLGTFWYWVVACIFIWLSILAEAVLANGGDPHDWSGYLLEPVDAIQTVWKRREWRTMALWSFTFVFWPFVILWLVACACMALGAFLSPEEEHRAKKDDKAP